MPITTGVLWNIFSKDDIFKDVPLMSMQDRKICCFKSNSPYIFKNILERIISIKEYYRICSKLLFSYLDSVPSCENGLSKFV